MLLQMRHPVLPLAASASSCLAFVFSIATINNFVCKEFFHVSNYFFRMT